MYTAVTESINFRDLFMEVMSIYHKSKTNGKILMLSHGHPKHLHIYDFCTGDFFIKTLSLILNLPGTTT